MCMAITVPTGGLKIGTGATIGLGRGLGGLPGTIPGLPGLLGSGLTDGL